MKNLECLFATFCYRSSELKHHTDVIHFADTYNVLIGCQSSRNVTATVRSLNYSFHTVQQQWRSSKRKVLFDHYCRSDHTHHNSSPVLTLRWNWSDDSDLDNDFNQPTRIGRLDDVNTLILEISAQDDKGMV